MRAKKSLPPLSICLLGAINGLLIGLIGEEMRIAYMNYQMRQAMLEYAESDLAADFFYRSREPFVPLMCLVTFAAVGYLIYRYFINHPQALLWLWLIIGGIGLWSGNFMATSSSNILSFMSIVVFAILSYLAHRSWTNHPQSAPLIWMVIGISAVVVVAASAQMTGLLWLHRPELRSPITWLLCLAIVVVINLIYGSVMQLLFPRYHRWELEQTSV